MKEVLIEFAEWLGQNEYEYLFYNLYSKAGVNGGPIYYTVEQLVEKFLDKT